MKKIFTFLLLLAWYTNYSQTCLPEGITFSSQTQIDDFSSDYPGCTQILGDVTIKESVPGNITNLNSLSVLTSIGGDLYVGYNSALTSLSGLDNVDSIGLALIVIDNEALTSLSGLLNVDTIAGVLSVLGNDALVSLSGLDNVNSIGGYLKVSSNDALVSLSGLDNVKSIGMFLEVENNAVLTSLSGLDNVNSIGWWLNVSFNDSLTSLSGLDNVNSIGDYLYVRGNPALTSLSGLDNISSIGGYLRIADNGALKSLSGLDNIDYTTITTLYLENSNYLSTCEVKSICDYLDNSGSASISNNATGCNSVDEVKAACELVPTIEMGGAKDEVVVHPNPTTGMVEITSRSPGQTITILRVTDVTGRLVPALEIEGNSSINLTNQPDGMYFITLQTGTQILLKRVIKN
jgi:Secretion system C-terminal sorting domain